MVYKNWLQAARPANALLFNWYELETFITYLHQLRESIIEATRKASEVYMPAKLQVSKPEISRTVRFDHVKNYLCETTGDWSIMYDTIRLSLNIMLYPNRLDRNYPMYSTPGEVELQVIGKINSLLKMIEANESGMVVNQESFEKRYQLEWSADNDEEDVASTAFLENLQNQKESNGEDQHSSDGSSSKSSDSKAAIRGKKASKTNNITEVLSL